MRINLNIPDALGERMTAAIAAESARTGLEITATAWINRAISEAVQAAEKENKK